MKSVYSRQLALVVTLILICFLLLGVSFSALSYRYTIRTERESLEENAEFIADFTAAYRARGRDIRSEDFRLYVYSLAKMSKANVILCERDGEVVYSANGQGQEDLENLVGQYVDQNVIQSAMTSESFESLGTLGGLYQENRYTKGAPIVMRTLRGDTTLGVVFVSTAVDRLTAMWRNLFSLFILVTVIVGLLAFVLTSISAKRQTKPLTAMVDAVGRFGHGEFDVRMGEKETIREDEIGELARAFNTMADSLARSEARRSEFVANISHELKTPMTTIAGFADGILDGTIPAERQTQALETISSETRRLSRLVRKMLDISQLQSEEKGITVQEQFDAVEVCARTLVSLEGKINDKKLDVIADFPEEPMKVWGDPDAITQVCYNLLDNAIKFAREGGHLWVILSKKGGKAYVTVRDEGETIPPEEIALIFDRFHKSDKSRSMDRDGVGLGLSIVRAILNDHKENITVKSEDGVTEFQFTLTLV